MAKQEEQTEQYDFTNMRVYKEDKDFYVQNRKLEEYLCFKYKILIKKQEDILKLIRLELEEILKNVKK